MVRSPGPNHFTAVVVDEASGPFLQVGCRIAPIRRGPRDRAPAHGNPGGRADTIPGMPQRDTHSGRKGWMEPPR